MILGLHGLPGSGKDTIAVRAARFTKVPVERRSFADKLKQSCAALLGITLEQMEELKREATTGADRTHGIGVFNYCGGPEFQPYHDAENIPIFTMREFLQRYGTEAHRDVFGKDFWLDQCLPLPRVMSIGDIHNNPYAEGKKLIIVTDVRFPNEAERVRLLGGKMAEVIGPDHEGSAHASDQHIGAEWINYKIQNGARDDDFQLLDGQLQVLLAHLGLRKVSTDGATTASVG